MFIVPPVVQRNRLDECRNCKYHKDTPLVGITCGTFLTGGDAEPEKVTYYRRKVKLCGCKMSWKTKYALAKCPIGKWDVHNLTDQQIENLQIFIDELTGKSTLKPEQVQKLFQWKSRLTGKREEPQYCASCVRDLIAEMRDNLLKMKTLNPK